MIERKVILVMFKLTSFSTTLLCVFVGANLAIKPASADHTDDGFYICNYTKVTHSFTMVDVDYNQRKNFSLEPNKCVEYWNYEQIEFINNFDALKRYSLTERNRYIFKYSGDGTIDVVRESY